VVLPKVEEKKGESETSGEEKSRKKMIFFPTLHVDFLLFKP